MSSSRRRVAYRPALESLSMRITPSDMSLCSPVPMPIDSMTYTTTACSTCTIDNVPPMYPPYGTPGTTAADYV